MISVVLPTYKEVENIGIIVPMIFDVLSKADIEGEVIIVDDNSPDGTAEAAAALARHYPLKVHVRKHERGLATAVMKGFDLASGDVVVVMDADLSHPVEKIPEMVQPILENICDITVGSRYVNGGGCDHWPASRRFISRFSGFLASGLAKLSDPTSGFMAVRKSILKTAALDPVGWKIVLETVVKTGARLMEIPIVFSDRQKGKSKLDKKAQVEYIAHLWKLYCFKHPVVCQFLMFCFIGFLGLIVDTIVLTGFVELAGLDPRVAACFAFLAAVSFNYILNRFWTFVNGRSIHAASSYAWFVTFCFAGFFLRIGIMHMLIECFNMGVGYRYILASIIGITTASIFNFTGTKLVVFSENFNRVTGDDIHHRPG